MVTHINVQICFYNNLTSMKIEIKTFFGISTCKFLRGDLFFFRLYIAYPTISPVFLSILTSTSSPPRENSALAISYSKLMRRAKSKKINISLKNTMFAAIGGASKSGAMIAYNFRLINELAAANFLDEETIKFIDRRV